MSGSITYTAFIHWDRCIDTLLKKQWSSYVCYLSKWDKQDLNDLTNIKYVR